MGEKRRKAENARRPSRLKRWKAAEGGERAEAVVWMARKAAER